MPEQTSESAVLDEPTVKPEMSEETVANMLKAVLTFQYDAYAKDDTEDGMPVRHSRRHASYTNLALIENRLTAVLEATNGRGEGAEVMMWNVGSSYKVLVAFFLAVYIQRDMPHSDKLYDFLTIVHDREKALSLRKQLEDIITKIKSAGQSEGLLSELATQVAVVINDREALYLTATPEALPEAMVAHLGPETLKTYLNAELEFLATMWLPEEDGEEPICKHGDVLYDIVEMAMFMVLAEQDFSNSTALNIRAVQRLLNVFGDDLKATNWGDKFTHLEELTKFASKDLDPDQEDGATPVRMRLSIKPTECVFADGVYSLDQWGEGEFQVYTARAHLTQNNSLCRSMIALGGVAFDMTTPLSDTFRRV